eukprot:1139209-Pelagomonas_calceolata.AAC.1
MLRQIQMQVPQQPGTDAHSMVKDTPQPMPVRISYASGSHLKRCIEEGLTPIATRARTRDPPPAWTRMSIRLGFAF